MKIQHGILALGLLSFGAFAQTTISTQGQDHSGKISKPQSISLGKVLKLIGNSFHTFDVSYLGQEIQKNGKTEQKYVPTLGLSGRVLCIMFAGSEDDREARELIAGKNAGGQLLPFTVKVNPKNDSRYLSVSAIGLKNMISYNENFDLDGTFNLVDDGEILTFKFDQGMTLENINSYNWRIVDGTVKVDVLNAKGSSQYLALVGGGALGGGKAQIRLENGETVYLGNRVRTEKNVSSTFAADYRAGLEYGVEGKVRLTTKAMVNGTSYGRSLIAYNPSASGEQTHAANFNSRFFSPSVELSTGINKKGKRPTRLGASVGANLPLRNSLDAGKHSISAQEMNNRMNSKYNARVFINF